MNNDIKIKYPKCLDKLSDIFMSYGCRLYIVGGFLRDTLLGYDCYDIDLCSKASPQNIKKMLNDNNEFQVIDCNLPLATLHIKYENNIFEYTSFRKESYIRDGSHVPNKIHLTASLKEDALRRDFTINAIYYDIYDGNIIDKFEGITDIENKILRTTRNPNDVFCEDALRILRMCRICAQTMFYPTDDVITAARNLNHLILNLSKERIVQEMQKLLTADTRYPKNDKDNILYGIKMLFDIRVSDIILSGAELNQVLKAYKAENIEVKIALLCMDTDNTSKSLDYICANNYMKTKVIFLLDNIGFHDNNALEFIAEKGYEKCRLLKEFLSMSIVNIKFVNLGSLLKNMVRNNEILSADTLAVNGQDIMDIMKIESSPQVGIIKKELLMHVIKFPEQNTKEHLVYHMGLLNNCF